MSPSGPGTDAGATSVGSRTGLRIELAGAGETAKVDGMPVASPGDARPQLERARAGGELVIIEANARTPEATLDEWVAAARRAGASRIELKLLPYPSEIAATPAAVPPAPSSQSAPAAAPPSAPIGSLPEVVVRTVGMHIGGGPNDDATKTFFRKPLEERVEDFRRCYPLVEELGKGGTFGADLTVGSRGGRPEVRQPRSTLGSARFRDCMLAALAQVRFPKPPGGAKTISYSLRFGLGGK